MNQQETLDPSAQSESLVVHNFFGPNHSCSSISPNNTTVPNFIPPVESILSATKSASENPSFKPASSFFSLNESAVPSHALFSSLNNCSEAQQEAKRRRVVDADTEGQFWQLPVRSTSHLSMSAGILDCNPLPPFPLSSLPGAFSLTRVPHLPPAAVSPSPPSLSDLGEDLLMKILQIGQPTAWDLCRFACVNKQWKGLCYSKAFWKKLRIGTGSVRQGVEQLASRCSSMVEIHIDDPRCELHVLHPIFMACSKSLRRVLINCDNTEEPSRNEASICSILWILSLYCKNVESVELISDGREGSFGYLENKAMWYLTSGFRQLKHFSCLCRESVTKQSIYLLVIAWRDLHCLRIDCSGLQLEDLLALRKCHALRLLELVGNGTTCAEKMFTKSDVDSWGLSLIGSNAGGGGSSLVLHKNIEVVVLSKMRVETGVIRKLAKLCPALKRVVLRDLTFDSKPEIESIQVKQLEALSQEFLAAGRLALVLDGIIRHESVSQGKCS